jgi:hypothetical protein
MYLYNRTQSINRVCKRPESITPSYEAFAPAERVWITAVAVADVAAAVAAADVTA